MFDKKSLKQIMGLIVFTILVYTGVQNLGFLLGMIGSMVKMVLPLILGGCIAFVLNIPMSKIEEFLLKNTKSKNKALIRGVSYVLSLIFVVGIVFVVVFIVVPELAMTLVSVVNSFEKFIPTAITWLQDMIENQQVLEFMESNSINWGGIVDFLKNWATSLLSSWLSIFQSVASILTNFFIGIIFSCYILLQKELLQHQGKKIIQAIFKSKQVAFIEEVASLSYSVFSSFVTGQCLEALILGAMFLVSMTLLRLPYALLVGVLIAFTALIPIVGGFIGCAIGAFLIFMQSGTQALIFIVLFLVLQQLEGNLIYPRVVGGTVGLPSLWVLFAVIVGGNVMGILGIILFIPLLSIFYALFKKWVNARLEKKGITV